MSILLGDLMVSDIIERTGVEISYEDKKWLKERLRLIDADELKAKVEAMVEHKVQESDYDYSRNQTLDYVADILIEDAPTIYAEPVKHGEWKCMADCGATRKRKRGRGMIDYNKPPLGVKPAELHAEERAKELADAISRNILDGNFYCCKMWADELKTQIEIAKRYKLNKSRWKTNENNHG